MNLSADRLQTPQPPHKHKHRLANKQTACVESRSENVFAEMETDTISCYLMALLPHINFLSLPALKGRQRTPREASRKRDRSVRRAPRNQHITLNMYFCPPVRGGAQPEQAHHSANTHTDTHRHTCGQSQISI